jgi:hypothetical protein
MAIVVFWLLLALVVAVAAGSRGRSGAGWFFLSVILSPLIGLILVLVLPNLRHERLIADTAANHHNLQLEPRSGPFEPDGVYADIPYRVLGDGSVEALMQGAVVHFRSADHLFQILGGGSPFEPRPIQQELSVAEPPVKMVSTPKVLIIVGLVVGAILYSAKLLDDHARQVSEFSPERATRAAPQR